jgi:hypothetical protein
MRHPCIHGIAITLVLTVAALLSGACFPHILPDGGTTAGAAALPSRPARPSTATYHLNVYFSRFPRSTNDFTTVFPLARVSSTPDIATFAIQLLIAGPTPAERRAGYFSELNSLLTGPSACSAPYPTGGPDFVLHLDRKGPRAARGTATLRFCRALSSPGIGADARVRAEITATLTQFARIKHVVILTRDGHCFGDESGADRCLS